MVGYAVQLAGDSIRGFAHGGGLRPPRYGADFMVPKSQCQHYKDIGHPEWNTVKAEDCKWAEKLRESHQT